MMALVLYKAWYSQHKIFDSMRRKIRASWRLVAATPLTKHFA